MLGKGLSLLGDLLWKIVREIFYLFGFIVRLSEEESFLTGAIWWIETKKVYLLGPI